MAEKVCPWWVGYLLVSPLRKLIQDPVRILKPYVRENMRVLDIGSAMGYFSLPMAELAGKNGKTVCVDLQEKMLGGLKRRAQKAGLLERIEFRLANESSLNIPDLKDSVDFALIFYMLHEVEDKERLLREVYAALKPQGILLFVEPKGHVSNTDFENSLNLAKNCGFNVKDLPSISYSKAAALLKGNES